MKHLAQSKNTSITRSLMAGLACGIVAAVLNAAFGYFYRKTTAYSGAEFFEPLLIFIAFPIFFVVAGVIYYEMADTIKKGGLIFSVLFIAIMLVAVIFLLDNFDKEKKGLLMGMIVISGLLLSFLLPFLATHAQVFMDKEEYTESVD